MRIYWLNMNLCFEPESKEESISLERFGDAFGAAFGAGVKVGHAEVFSGSGEVSQGPTGS